MKDGKPEPLHRTAHPVLILALLLILTLVSSCTGWGGYGRTPTQRPTAEFRTGTQGVLIQFMPNLPPARQYDDQPFDVVLKVWNAGAENVGSNNDRVYLSGFDPSIVTGLSAFGAPIPRLEGKTQYNLDGSFDYVSFKGTIRNLKSMNVDRYPINPLLATACYQYKTVSAVNVCIDPDPFSSASKTKACVPGAASAGSQGAPVAIQSVRLEPSSGRTRFQIDIANVGGGDVFLPGAVTLNKCSPYDARGIEFNEIGKIRLDKMEVAGVSIAPSCRPVDSEGYIRLTNGRATLVCDYATMSQGAAYVTPLITELSYGVRTIAAANIQIFPSR